MLDDILGWSFASNFLVVFVVISEAAASLPKDEIFPGILRRREPDLDYLPCHDRLLKCLGFY